MDKCKVCDQEFKRKYPRGKKRKIYCSKKCKYSDSEVYKRICKTCGKEFKAIFLTKNKEYCSLACIQRHPCQLCGKIITGRVTFQSGEKKFCGRTCAAFVNRTLKSKISYMPNGFARSIKDHGKIICNRCGIDDIQFLIVHHIDRNRLNNKIENLETLCANCHHKIHWGDSEKRMRCVQLAQLIAKQ
jgi:5-methylcytosine-specific restriction endonuclease McrA